MKDKYIISITGIQTVDGESDTIEVMTTGEYEEQDDKKIIRYKEYSAEEPTETTDTVVTLRGGLLTIDRRGAVNSGLILEKGRRHQCHYRTIAGDMMIGVFTDCVTDNLDIHGGELKASYELDFFGDIVSKNEFHISLKEKEQYVKN